MSLAKLELAAQCTSRDLVACALSTGPCSGTCHTSVGFCQADGPTVQGCCNICLHQSHASGGQGYKRESPLALALQPLIFRCRPYQDDFKLADHALTRNQLSPSSVKCGDLTPCVPRCIFPQNASSVQRSKYRSQLQLLLQFNRTYGRQ